MIKILQARLQQMWTVNFQMFKLVLEKAEEPEIKLPSSGGSSKKQDSSSKTSTSALLTVPKSLTVWITTNCGKFFKRWEHQTIVRTSWEICRQVKKEQLELDMEQQLSSVQTISCVRLSAIPWIAARQASLFITSSWSSLRLTSIESMMPSSHRILCCPLLLLPPIYPSIRIFSNENSLHEVAEVLVFQL